MQLHVRGREGGRRRAVGPAGPGPAAEPGRRAREARGPAQPLQGRPAGPRRRRAGQPASSERPVDVDRGLRQHARPAARAERQAGGRQEPGAEVAAAGARRQDHQYVSCWCKAPRSRGGAAGTNQPPGVMDSLCRVDETRRVDRPRAAAREHRLSLLLGRTQGRAQGGRDPQVL